MFGSFQTLVTSFLSLEGDFYCKIEAPENIFDSLPQWREFSNPVDVNPIYLITYLIFVGKVIE